MSLRHHLALCLTDTGFPLTLRVADASSYAPLLEVGCPELQVRLPGAEQFVLVSRVQGPEFDYLLTGLDLGLASNDKPLPDGLYELTYAVAPHQKTRLRVPHLRVTSLRNELYRSLCQLAIETGEPRAEQLAHLKELRQMELYLQAAVAQVELCQNPGAGQELFAYAQRLLARYRQHACPSCASR